MGAGQGKDRAEQDGLEFETSDYCKAEPTITQSSKEKKKIINQTKYKIQNSKFKIQNTKYNKQIQ